MPRWRILVNPDAGPRTTSVDEVTAAVDAAGVDGVVELAKSVEEMEERVLAHADGQEDGLAAVGGDGTLNLVINTLLSKTDIESPLVAVLPAGTGCDLLRTFALPQSLGEAARHLTTDDAYSIDVARIDGDWGERYFVNVAQTGVGAAAAESARGLPRGLGKARYPVAFAARLPTFPRCEVTVETERRTYESEALAVILANAQFFAGGWNVAPRATLIDGVLDVQVFNARKRQAPALVPKIIRGTHLREREVRRFQAARFKVETTEDWPVETDGDHIGNAPFSGEVVPAAVRLKI